MLSRTSAIASRAEAESRKTGTRRLGHPFPKKSALQDSLRATQMLRSISNPHPFSRSDVVIRLRRFLHFIGSEIHLVRRPVVEALVWTPRIIKIEINRKRCFQLPHRLVSVEIDILVLDAAPQSFDEHIVDPTPLAVHAYAHALGLQRLGEVIGGELAALVGVEDLGVAVARERLLQGLDT